MQWQRPQQRLIEPLEPLPATAIEPLERALAQVLQQLGNRTIEFMQTEELLVPNRAITQRSTTCTATSALALFCDLCGRTCAQPSRLKTEAHTRQSYATIHRSSA